VDGGFLILAHEAAITFDIGTEDGSELAFHTGLFLHQLEPTMSVNMIAASRRVSVCTALLGSFFMGTDYPADVAEVSTVRANAEASAARAERASACKPLILIQASSAAMCSDKVAVLENSPPKEEAGDEILHAPT
jgi:hypothetical protein